MEEDRVEELKTTTVNAWVDCHRNGRRVDELAFRDGLIIAVAIITGNSVEDAHEEIGERALAAMGA